MAPAPRVVNDRAETIRHTAMVAVIDRIESLGDDTPPWLAPVIAAHAAMVSLVDQLVSLGVVEQAEAIAELAEHLEPVRAAAVVKCPACRHLDAHGWTEGECLCGEVAR